mmetsp:Transcript_13942/g.29374  ORF Transcript_13942/g.29374 Transcript_13942/m.29374 type:complete len:232 (-) Transcript_13942:2331-3026(-)
MFWRAELSSLSLSLLLSLLLLTLTFPKAGLVPRTDPTTYRAWASWLSALLFTSTSLPSWLTPTLLVSEPWLLARIWLTVTPLRLALSVFRLTPKGFLHCISGVDGPGDDDWPSSPSTGAANRMASMVMAKLLPYLSNPPPGVRLGTVVSPKPSFSWGVPRAFPYSISEESDVMVATKTRLSWRGSWVMDLGTVTAAVWYNRTDRSGVYSPETLLAASLSLSLVKLIATNPP